MKTNSYCRLMICKTHGFADGEKEAGGVSLAIGEETTDDERQQVSEHEHVNDSIKLYLQDIRKSKLLSAEDERELVIRIAKGDKDARNKMIESNLRLVVKIAMCYKNRGLSFPDLIEEGNIGLIKAVDRFRITKECRFSTYAIWWIRQSIERSIDNQVQVIKLPVRVSNDIHRMIKVTRNLNNTMNCEPSTEQIASEMGVDIVYLGKLKLLLNRACSIDKPMGDEGDFSLLDTIEDTSVASASDLLENSSQFAEMIKEFKALTYEERDILTLRFGLAEDEPLTLDAIGKIYGVTRERIRQIECIALKKLRSNMETTPC